MLSDTQFKIVDEVRMLDRTIGQRLYKIFSDLNDQLLRKDQQIVQSDATRILRGIDRQDLEVHLKVK